MFLSLIKSTKHLSLKPSLSSMKILSRNISLSGVNRLKESIFKLLINYYLIIINQYYY